MQQKVEKKRTFRKDFLQISVSMLLVILLGFGVMYGIVKKIIIQQNVQMAFQSFQQVQAQFEDANHTANTIATQVLLDDICSEFLNASTVRNMNSIALNRVRSQLSLYQNTNPSVDSIYIYNRKADLFVSSGSRFRAVGKEEFADREIIEIMEESKAFYKQKLIPRERVSEYPNQTERKETVYSYLLFTPKEPEGNVVVVNMKLDSMIQEILQTESMKDSVMVVVDEGRERILEQQTMDFEETAAMKDTVKEMVSQKESYREYEENGVKYGILYIYSSKSEWNYIKVTSWKTMFSALTGLQQKMIAFTVLGVVAVLIISMWFSLSIARLHGKLEMKYARIAASKKSDTQIVKERFLVDFVHGRKVFSRQNLRKELEKFDFPVSEEQKFTVVILMLENYGEFLETFGKKGTYDIKFGFQNIFEETFGEKFRTLGIINRDETMTFILEITEENANGTEGCFRKFCENVSVFVPWDFMLFGSSRAENIERIPEMNNQLRKVITEGFFYPSNSYVMYDKIKVEHGRNADFQKLDVGNIQKNLGNAESMKETYKALAEELKECSMSDYMNAMTWLGISIVRSAKKCAFSEKEGGEFVVQLAECKKASDVDELFLGLFETISQNQEKNTVKKVVTGKLDEVKQYIEKNFRDPDITLEQLGDEFGVSANYLGRLFKKDTGMSVADYINAERLEWVLGELENTDRPAKEIAEECGFASTNYFYTYFRKKIGVTPQAYREQVRKGDAENRKDE